MKELTVNYKYAPKTAFNLFMNVLLVIFVLFIAVYITFGALFSKIYVVGTSMKNTLVGSEFISDPGGDYVYVSKYISPERGDIVVVNAERRTIIKRVVGLGGDTVELKQGKLFVNGREVEEPYVDPAYNTPDLDKNTMEAVRVPNGHLFLLGDNRDDSIDSRGKYGFVSLDSVVGVVTDWSMEHKDFITGWNTFFEFTIPGLFKKK